jgi:predicted dehydrogenase
MTGILLIGAGVGVTHGVGSMHIEAWQRVNGARIVAVADINPTAARRGAAAAGAEAFTDYREALKLPGVDAVDICTPSHLHRAMTEGAARAGKHVLVEKPVALTLEDTDAMIGACREANVVLMVVQSQRYSANSRLLQQVIREGRLGQLLYYHSDSFSGFWATGDRNMWQLNQRASGGHMLHNGIHHTDWLLRLFEAEPKAVHAQGRKVTDGELEIWDRFRMQVEFTDGRVGVMGLGRSNLPRNAGGFTFHQAIGTEATLEFRTDLSQNLAITMEDGYRFLGAPGLDFADVLSDFVLSMADGVSRVPGEQARAALLVALAAEESARSGQTIHLAGGWRP